MKKTSPVAAKKPVAARRKAANTAAGQVEEPPGSYLVAPPPARAKTFRVGGSQAVRLPKAFRLPDGEVLVEKRGEEIILKPAPKKRMTEAETIAWFRASFKARPGSDDDWLKIERPGPETNKPVHDLDW